MAERLCIALTCGEPAGIGAEVALKALDGGTPPGAEILLVGPRAVWERAAELVERPSVLSRWLLHDVPLPAAPDWSWGTPTLRSAQAAVSAVQVAARLALEGNVEALVTAPLTKEGLRAAGEPFPGHTELLEHLSGPGCRATMMLAGARLRVVLVTTHLPLAEVARAVTRQRVLDTLESANRGLREDLGISAPKIAVAALNPHAGEAGVIGREEEAEIEPAVRAARLSGIDAEGPFPADTLFFKAANGAFDAVVAMYHDQGLIPLKLLHFYDGVNVTLGLPIVRTSPDHGTAFDIAGQAVARADSFRCAVQMACEIAQRRGRSRSGVETAWRSRISAA